MPLFWRQDRKLGLESTSLSPFLWMAPLTLQPKQEGSDSSLPQPHTRSMTRPGVTFLPKPSWVSPMVSGLSSLFSFHRWGHWEPREMGSLPSPGFLPGLCSHTGSKSRPLYSLSTIQTFSTCSLVVLFYISTGSDLVKIADDLLLLPLKDSSQL